MPKFKISENTRRELERFKEYARKMEYTASTITGYCTYVSRFLRRTGLLNSNELKASIETFLETEKTNRSQTFKNCRAAMRLYFNMVTGCRLREKAERILDPAIACSLQRFREYSLDVKGLTESTVTSEISHIRCFLEYASVYGKDGDASGLTAEDIRNYVVERFARLSDSSKGRCVTSIRNFFRCQEFYGEPVHPSIFRLPLSPAVWKRSAFPATIDVNVFNSLHLIPDSRSDIGKRNRCIVLCFTELALRCSEVAALTLDNFNWRDQYVVVRKTKNGSERRLPLSETLWNALNEYLAQSRPQTACRALFVRFSHQRGEAMGASQLRGVIRRNGAKAGLEDRASGTHILRRTAATRLYNSGNSLKQTADILGHESLDSTTYYANADIAGLRTVASPWPGGDHNVE